MSKRHPIGIELFAGCGGMSTGFLDAGLHVAAGFEIDRRAVEAYDYNHRYRGSRGVVADLSSVSGEELLTLAGIKKVDFLIGGPPCQPFSIVGKRKGEDDERSDLMNHYARIVEELRPSVLLMENVPNLSKIDGGRFIGRIVKRFQKLGYKVGHHVIAAADFGVPQLRKRLFVLGIQGGKSVEFPEPTYGIFGREHVSVKEAIDDLPDAGEFGDTGVHNHEPTMHTPDMIGRLSKLQPGQRERGSFHDRLHPDRLSYTLRAGSGNFSPLRPIHYRYNRVITVRESARIQGFSDSFIWPDWIPRLQQYRQVGNAVPPPVAHAFAVAIGRQLGWRLSPKKFLGNVADRVSPITMTDEERVLSRTSRIRGASAGLKKRA